MKKATAKPKPKAKSRPRKGKPARKTKRKPPASLQARLETEFAQAVTSAKTYINNPDQLRGLVEEASRKASSLPKEMFKETWAYFQAMLRLVRAYYRGDYREVATTTLVVIIAAIIYIVNPFDLLPDWIPGLGLLDDAFILALAVRRTRQTLDEFMVWETAAR